MTMFNSAPVTLHAATEIISIDDWEQYLDDGKRFLATAVAANEKQKRGFTPEVIYNLVAMAIEKYIMAFLMKNGDLAENHTMEDLTTALERHLGPLPDLRSKMLFLDSFQDICDLQEFVCTTPTSKQIVHIIEIGIGVKQLLLPHFESFPKQ